MFLNARRALANRAALSFVVTAVVKSITFIIIPPDAPCLTAKLFMQRQKILSAAWRPDADARAIREWAGVDDFATTWNQKQTHDRR
jgi:hypothetical protein